MREDGSLVGGKGRKGRVYNREELKKILRTASNRPNLRMSMNEFEDPCRVCNDVPKLRN